MVAEKRKKMPRKKSAPEEEAPQAIQLVPREESPNPGGLFVEPLLTRPEKIAIVALGASSRSFIHQAMTNQAFLNSFDEVWTVNRGFRAFQHDKVFVMDDLRWVEQHNSNYAEFLKKHDRPVITTTVYPEFPNAVAYPYQEVMETIEDDIFNVNTISYMTAYAIHIRVKEVSIYGADFCYPNGNFAESGGQAVAYLCGMMRQYGMIHRLPGDTTLLYANKVKQYAPGVMGREPYGYHRIKQMEKKAAEEKAMKEARRAAVTVPAEVA